MFDAQAIDVLRSIFADVCSDAHAKLMEMDGENDHVHIEPKTPDSALTTASLSALSFPARKGGAARVVVSGLRTVGYEAPRTYGVTLDYHYR